MLDRIGFLPPDDDNAAHTGRSGGSASATEARGAAAKGIFVPDEAVRVANEWH